MASAAAYNAITWTVQSRLGVGTTAPTQKVVVRDNANTTTRIWAYNPNAGTATRSELYLSTATGKGVILQKLGGGATATWSGTRLANWSRLRTDAAAGSLIVTTGGDQPLLFGTGDTERMRIFSYGGVGLYSAGGNGVYVDQPSLNGVYVHRPGRVGVEVERPRRDGFYVIDPGDNGFEVYYSSYTGKDGVNVWNGNIKVNNGSFIDSGTTLNVPDYVFKAEYPLLSLAELAAPISPSTNTCPTCPRSRRDSGRGRGPGCVQHAPAGEGGGTDPLHAAARGTDHCVAEAERCT